MSASRHLQASDTPTPAGLQAPLVFLAEDDAQMRSLLAETLVADGCAVRVAEDGRALLALLSAVSRHELPMPSLIVTDVRMPKCSGMDVLTALSMAGWVVPVIVVTGFGDHELHAKAQELGAAAVLDKPFDIDALRCAVKVLTAATTS